MHNMPSTAIDLDNTRQDGTFGQAAMNGCAVFLFGHQKAKLFISKGEYLGVLAIYKG